MKEGNISQLCRIAAAECGVWLWRNNRGMFLTLDGKRKTRAGLEMDGSSDLIGFNKRGQFVAIEVKVKGKKPSKSQQEFIDLVNKNGGIAGFVTSPEELKKLLLTVP